MRIKRPSHVGHISSLSNTEVKLHWDRTVLGWGPPGQTPLKVPNIEFDFNVSVDRVHWQTVTSKSNSRPYHSVKMRIRYKVFMYCWLGVQSNSMYGTFSDNCPWPVDGTPLGNSLCCWQGFRNCCCLEMRRQSLCWAPHSQLMVFVQWHSVVNYG